MGKERGEGEGTKKCLCWCVKVFVWGGCWCEEGDTFL